MPGVLLLPIGGSREDVGKIQCLFSVYPAIHAPYGSYRLLFGQPKLKPLFSLQTREGCCPPGCGLFCCQKNGSKILSPLFQVYPFRPSHLGGDLPLSNAAVTSLQWQILSPGLVRKSSSPSISTTCSIRCCQDPILFHSQYCRIAKGLVTPTTSPSSVLPVSPVGIPHYILFIVSTTSITASIFNHIPSSPVPPVSPLVSPTTSSSSPVPPVSPLASQPHPPHRHTAHASIFNHILFIVSIC